MLFQAVARSVWRLCRPAFLCGEFFKMGIAFRHQPGFGHLRFQLLICLGFRTADF